MDLLSASIDREVIKYGSLQNELLGCLNKCFESKSFCKPSSTNAIDFRTKLNELNYKNTSLSDNN